MNSKSHELNEAKNKLLEQIKRSDDVIASSIAQIRKLEDKAFEFLTNHIAELPEQQRQVDITNGEQNEIALQRYFKTLENIEKCAQAMRRARKHQIDAKNI